MRVFLIDTNVVSILFKPEHALYQSCFSVVGESQWFISFMTRAELLLWPRVNRWGPKRRTELISHMDLCTTLLPDEGTFGIWADIMAESRAAGRPVAASDAWIAAAARQWDLALATTDYHDFEHLDRLTLLPISM
jgi:predicted nucleic acid-binding protein